MLVIIQCSIFFVESKLIITTTEEIHSSLTFFFFFSIEQIDSFSCYYLNKFNVVYFSILLIIYVIHLVHVSCVEQ